MAGKRRQGKGVYGGARLPIAGGYPATGTRRWTLLAGLVGCAGLAVWLGATVVAGKRGLAPGPVASAHATFESQCAACHVTTGAVADEGCLVCHERFVRPGGAVAADEAGGAYSFAAHFAAHTAEGGAAGAGSAGGTADGAPGGGPAGGTPAALPAASRDVELPCASCHPEHGGRAAAITAVDDRRCASCHGFAGFDRGHPDFGFARAGAPDDESLRFTHRFHVKQLLAERDWDDPQRACLVCHRPEPDGTGFLPLDFEASCGSCHLTTRSRTPRLPAGDPADPQAPGVLTLAAIQARGGPGSRWAFFTDPGEVRSVGNSVEKRPVYHRDPWVMTNLAAIRRTLDPELGLAELLPASIGPSGGGGAAAALYLEAIETLERRAVELRSRPEPEVQSELRRVEALLAAAERRVRAGESGEAAEFAAPAEPDPSLAPERVAALRHLALDLTEPCRQCHVVTDAAIRRVDRAQRALPRAVFSHRAHVLEVPFCTDCHGAIPGLSETTATTQLADEPLDAAATWNLPRVEVCRDCHRPGVVSTACVTCHRFHPDRGRAAELLAYRPGDTATAGAAAEGAP
jgi:hypothetical protein